MEVVVTESRVELRGGNGLVGAIPLAAVASFAMSSAYQDCLGIVYRKANRTIACWIFACKTPADTKAALATLGAACNRETAASHNAPSSPGELGGVGSSTDTTMRRGGGRSNSGGPSIAYHLAPVPLAPTTPAVGASLMDSPGVARRSGGPDGGGSRISKRFGSNALSATPRESQKHAVSRSDARKAAAAVAAAGSLPGGAGGIKSSLATSSKPKPPLVRANTYRPQSMGCAIQCAFVGITDISQVPGVHKDEQARLDSALANADPAVFERSKCTEVLITVIGGLLRFRPVDKGDGRRGSGAATESGRLMERRTMSQTKRRAEAAAAAQSLEETKILHTAIKFVGHGTKKHTNVFAVLIGKPPSFLYYTFVCDVDAEATNSVLALARAFGAGQKMDALLTSMSYSEAVAEGDRLFASSLSAAQNSSNASAEFHNHNSNSQSRIPPASPMSSSFPSAGRNPL